MTVRPVGTPDQFVTAAEKLLGTPYVFGGSGPHGVDCSGLVVYAAEHTGNGFKLPHFTGSLAKIGKKASLNDLQTGDLVFSNWGEGPNSHVGIYVGNNRMVVARHHGTVVQYQTLDTGYKQHVTAVRRLGQLSTSGASVSTSSGGGLTPNGTASSTTGGGGGLNPDGSSSGTLGTGNGTKGTGGDGLTAIANALTGAVKPLTRSGLVADTMVRAFLPSNVVRIVCGVCGILFLCWALWMLGSHLRNN